MPPRETNRQKAAKVIEKYVKIRNGYYGTTMYMDDKDFDNIVKWLQVEVASRKPRPYLRLAGGKWEKQPVHEKPLEIEL